MAGFETRPLGNTSLRATVLGLGTGTLGGHRIEVARQEAEAVVCAAWSAGVRYFDTAPFYGFGRACRILGDALRELPRDEWVLSTKVGRLLRPRADPSAPPGRSVSRCRSSRFSTIPTPASCAPSRTACSASAWRGSTFFTCTTSVRRSMARMPIPESFGLSARADTARSRNCAPQAMCGRSGSASTSAKYCSRRWTGEIGTSSCLPDATRCSSRRHSTIYCRNALRREFRSSSARRSIPGSWQDATLGITGRRRRKSSLG